MTYFHDPWNLPSPSASMEGIGNFDMAIPLSTTKVVYSIVQQASANPDMNSSHELDPVLESILDQGSLDTTNYL
jgi:hypothetical protein